MAYFLTLEDFLELATGNLQYVILISLVAVFGAAIYWDTKVTVMSCGFPSIFKPN